MSVVAADSSVWIDYLRGVRNDQADTLGRLIEPTFATDIVIVPDVVLFEVLVGATNASDRKRADLLMRSLGVVPVGGEAAVVAAAARYRQLRRQGITIRKSIDVLIASWCIDNDVALLHRDRDCAPFEDVFGLRTA